MKLIVTILFITLLFNNSLCQYKTLITSTESDNYSELEVNTLYQINFSRILQNLKPLYTNQSLNNHSKVIAKSLQTKNKDTSIQNTIVIFYNDSISINHPLLKDTFDLIGIYTAPHQYNCQLMVITLDKRRKQIKWKDLDCPEFMKKKSKY